MPFNIVGQAVGSAIQGAANYATAKMNNEEALKREKLAREENYLYGEKAADAADNRTRALYSDLYSPEAQLAQIRAAGLSPAIYGGNGQGISGKGGVSGAQGSGATGVSPQVFGMSPVDIAQIGLLKAQTKKTEAEADTINGDNERGMAEIQNMYAQAGLYQASAAYQNVQTAIEKINLDIKEQTGHLEIEQIKARTQQELNIAYKTTYEWQQAKQDFLLNEETFETRVKQIEENLKLTTEQVLSQQQGRKLTAAQTQQALQLSEKLAYDMKLAYSKYWQDEKALELEIERLKHQISMDINHFNLQARESGHRITQGYLHEAFSLINNLANLQMQHALNGSVETTTTETWTEMYDKNGHYQGTRRSGSTTKRGKK